MSESEDEEDLAVYGTPLDPLDEDALPRKKPFALEDQVAKDKQGRRRFHGAFTGGFSAGFFNSVGSLEGWTPSTFKSSRSEKAGKKQQLPKDFMDDEDMEEHGIAPNVLRATADFSDQRGKKRERPHQSDGPIPGKPVLQELLQPARDTVGIKLLKQMGWKPGQGVGPRLTRTEKHRTKQERAKADGRVYGCLLPDFLQPSSSVGVEESSSSDEEDVTFAPDDFEPFICKTKDNCFGIGYVGLDKRPVLSSHINLFEPSFLNMTDKNKKVSISGQAFGVGAFEEEDADIYARDDMSQYDFALETSTTKKANNMDRKQRWSAGNEVNKLSTCIEGFAIAPQPAMRKKFFPPPILPRDFQPVHTARKSRFEPAPDKEVTTEASAKRSGLGRHNLTAEDRSHIIGEATRPAPLAATLDVSPEVPAEHSNSLTATDAFGNSRFRPFVACPEKQQRYDKFVTLRKQEQQEGLSRLQPLTMTEWEREHERMEFEQASRLYRPMTGVMSDRFVSATQTDDATNPLAVVERTRSEADKDLVQAAKMKMFGRLTRTRVEWRPTSLLCKRFNIPEPFTGCSVPPTSGMHKKTSKFSVFDFLDAAQHNSSELSQPPPVKVEREQPDTPPPKDPAPAMSNAEIPLPPMPAQDGPSTSVVVAEKAVDLESPDSLEKIDLFKAIFLSSSDESGSEEEEEVAAVTTIQPAKTPAEVFNNLERNTSPPRGIFANLDLDALNARSPGVPECEVVDRQSPAPPVKVETVSDDDELSDGMFGPQLPTTLPGTLVATSLTQSIKSLAGDVSPDSRWVEKPCKHPRKEKHSKKKSHKKDKKHKHVKHKDKHKKKHKSKR